MIRGLKRPNLKRTDYDLHPTFGTLASVPTFPPTYDTGGQGFGLRDQNADGQPFGCTNYSQAELATDLTGIVRKPLDLEAATQANARGGYHIRDSLDAARKLGWFKWYFQINPTSVLDYFDAIRYAQLMGAPNHERRTVTLGTPWFASWQTAINAGKRIMPMPTPDELSAIARNVNAYGWHNWVIDGWAPYSGVVTLRAKSWQGQRDPIYFPREVINVVMALKYTVAYTPTMLDAPNHVRRISLPLFDLLMSFIKGLPVIRYYA